jgi:iron(III) transport system substrate-binding protein
MMVDFRIMFVGLKKASIFSPGANPARIRIFLISFLVATGLILQACAPNVSAGNPIRDGEEIEGPAGRLVVYSGRAEPLIQPVLHAFQEQYPNVQVLLRSGSNSEIANSLLEEQSNPQADVFITTEVFTIQALDRAGVLQSYQPDRAAELPAGVKAASGNWVALTQRLRVIMYNTELVSEAEAPHSIFDLADPRWQGQIAAAGSSNGSMQAHVATLRQLIGPEAAKQWLRELLNNQVVFFGGHTDVRKAVGLGEFKVGLVNHYYYYLQLEEGSPVGIIYPDQEPGQIGMIYNLTATGIMNGSRNPEAAQALVDFLLSTEGQQLFAELNYEYPVIGGVPLHPKVEPLEGLVLADIDISQAADQFDETFDLMEEVGLP